MLTLNNIIAWSMRLLNLQMYLDDQIALNDVNYGKNVFFVAQVLKAFKYLKQAYHYIHLAWRQRRFQIMRFNRV